MNKKMIGLSALAVLSLAACNKNVENGVESHGSTYAGLIVSVKGNGSLRADTYGAANEYQANGTGKAVESAVSSLYVLMGKNQKTFASNELTEIGLTDYSPTGTDPKLKDTQVKSYKTTTPWLVAAGSQKMAVIVNGKAPFNAYKVTAEDGENVAYGQHGEVANDPKGTVYAKNLNEQLASLASDNNFVMSSDFDTKDVKDGISKGDVSAALTAATANGKNEAKNVFHFDLERLVCKGVVTKGTGLSGNIEDGSGTVDLASLKYAAINGATQTYVLAHHAGDRTMTSETAPGVGGSYAKYSSVIGGVKNDKVAPTAADAKGQDLVRLGNIGLSAYAETTGEKSKYAPIAVSATAGAAEAISKTDGVYFMENSMNKEIAAGGDKLTSYSETSDNNKAGYYRFAYAKVYAKVTPARVFYLDNSGTLKAGDATTSGVVANHGTFYQGATDGQLYATVAAAKAGNQDRVFIYNEGKCFYRALWNREYKTADMKQTSYASTRRNNIYVININKFKKLGMPFDPSDPNDPNLPAPGAKIVGDDPKKPTVVVPALPENSDGVTAVGVKPNGTVDEEAVKKDDPRLDKKETYMAVTATVLKWNVVTRGVDLE